MTLTLVPYHAWKVTLIPASKKKVRGALPSAFDDPNTARIRSKIQIKCSLPVWPGILGGHSE